MLKEFLSIVGSLIATVGQRSRPIKVGVELTYRCNSRCLSCKYWRASADVASELTVPEYARVLREIASLGGRRVGFVGGEPLLYPGIFEVSRYAKDLGLVVTIGTNGLLLEESVREILSCGVDILEVSLDGRESVHDKNRGVKGAFRLMLRGVRALMRRRRGRPLIQFNFTPNRVNVGELLHVARIAGEEGVDILSVEPAHMLNDYLNFEQNLIATPEQAERFREDIEILCSEFNAMLAPPLEYYRHVADFIANPENPQGIPEIPCYAGSLLIHLDPYGNVYSCPAKEVCVGNVRNRGLAAVVRSERMKEDLARIRRGNHRKCWLNSTVPMNLTIRKLRDPLSWPSLVRIAATEFRKRF